MIARKQVKIPAPVDCARWTSERVDTNVHLVRMQHERRKGWEQFFLLKADAHWDNAHSDHARQRKHLKEAVERGAGVFDFGDFFCAMQGRWDKRADQNQLRPEHRGNNYFDLLKSTATEFLAPYAGNLILMSHGNHETSVLDRHQVDLTAGLVERLRAMHNSPVYTGDYAGWVRFLFSDGTSRQSATMYYHHGYGGAAPVTRGTIQTNRRQAQLEDADLVVTGHIHKEWALPIPRAKLNINNQVVVTETLHVSLPTYKDEYGNGGKGWHVQQGRGPENQGAAWLRFYWDTTAERILWEVLRAR